MKYQWKSWQCNTEFDITWHLSTIYSHYADFFFFLRLGSIFQSMPLTSKDYPSSPSGCLTLTWRRENLTIVEEKPCKNCPFKCVCWSEWWWEDWRKEIANRPNLVSHEAPNGTATTQTAGGGWEEEKGEHNERRKGGDEKLKPRLTQCKRIIKILHETLDLNAMSNQMVG